jgi:DNA-binding response OmpR family regulator
LTLIADGLVPDLILTDVMMPEVDGYSLLSILRENKKLSDIPIILLSAKASEEARVEGLRSGADDFLTKPFSSAELMARIESRLNSSSRKKDAALPPNRIPDR